MDFAIEFMSSASLLVVVAASVSGEIAAKAGLRTYNLLRTMSQQPSNFFTA